MSPPDTASQAAAVERRAPKPALPSDALIVVPVRNMVLFPEIVLSGHHRTAGVDRGGPAGGARAAPGRCSCCSATREGRARPRRSAPRRHGRQHPALRHRARRRAPHDLPGRAALPHHRLRRGLAVPAGARPARPRAAARRRRDRGALPACCSSRCARCSTCCRRCRPSCARRSRRPAAPGALADLAAAYLDAKPEEKQDILETIDLVAAPRQGLAPARPSPRGAAPVQRDRQADQGLARRAPARDAAARADGRHPEASSARTSAQRRRRSPSSRRRSPRPGCRRRSRRRRARSCAGCSACPTPRPNTA